MVLKNPILFVFVFIAMALSVSSLIVSSSKGSSEKAETTFDRVMRTNTLRCGYYTFPPVFMRDPNTGEMSGLSVDMMNILSEKTGLKVEWVEESTFGNWVSAIQTGRYDAMCAPMWSDMALAREVIFTRPLYYAAIVPLVRADDTRFDAGDTYALLNRPETKVLTQDGNMIYFLSRESFPNATFLTMPAEMDGPSVVQNIITGKADVVLLDKNALYEYNKRNDVKLKALTLEKPLKAQPFVLPLHRSNVQLARFLDNAIFDMQLSGTMDRLLDKWEEGRGNIYIPVASPIAQ